MAIYTGNGSTTTAIYSIKQLDILKVTSLLFDRYKDTELEKAAKSYRMSANIRVYLNAPDGKKYANSIEECKKYIKKNFLSVFFDGKVRNKTKISLIFFLFGRDIFKMIYKTKDKITGEIRSN